MMSATGASICLLERTRSLIGFQGKYKLPSVGEATLVGVLGTFILNLARITVVVLIGAFLPAVFRVFYHDYLAALTTVLWLTGFWWFVFNSILES